MHRGLDQLRVSDGSPEPLGASLTGDGVNFAIHSPGASQIHICLYDEAGEREVARLSVRARTGPVWHCHIAGLGEGDRYGLRADGPFDPAAGLRFNAAKLLVDPYAPALDRPYDLHPSMFDYGEHAWGDSGPFMPKAIVTAPIPVAHAPAPVAWRDTVIYELHVKGFTRLLDGVPEALRGTFAGLAHPAAVAHLRGLGVTTVEILPAMAWISERHLPPLGLTNYWGYNPVSFLTPDPRLAPGGWAEVAAATHALHAAGIEVVLDVVLNHTGEGDALGPTVGLRGLDNDGYYRLSRTAPRRYIDDAGTGNILALDSPPALRLAMDALRAWRRFGGVDGFRFDLASVLGRRADGFDPAAPLLSAISQDPELRSLKLIAEPWDIGPGGYQLGRFPADWGEWNDQYRDTVRGFWRGDGVPLGTLARRLAGSQDLFGDRRPSRSINFVTSHDGFTLADLVAHERKHNDANGENGRDGTDDNRSWNHGVEGATEDPAVNAARLADQRALLATLLFSRGTPMLGMGAELGQSQGGNNNAYAQDNAIGWLDWAGADDSLTEFTARLIAIRRSHPALSADHFLTGAGFEPDVVWLRADGGQLTPDDWDSPAGETLTMALREGADRVALVIHRGPLGRDAELPAPDDGYSWSVLADSADPNRQGVFDGNGFAVASRSVVALGQTEDRRRPARGTGAEMLGHLAEAAGIEREWWNVAGERTVVAPDTQSALLNAMGLPCLTERQARESLGYLAELTDHMPPFAPASACYLPEAFQTPANPGGRPMDGEGRLFGLSAQLYALRRHDDWGIGDFTTLARLAEMADRIGAAAVSLNPQHALFPGQRDRASPYYPSDRRFLDPIYLDVARLGGKAAERFAERSGDSIDYPGVWRAKSRLLEASFVHEQDNPHFRAYVVAASSALERFATFSAIAETRPDEPWMKWPEALRDPKTARADPSRVLYQLYLQWLCEVQLSEAAAAAAPLAIGLIRDLAVGAAPDGAEVWANIDLMAKGVSIGAPPDPLGPQGQVWGLPPMTPFRLAAAGFGPIRELFRSNMRHAGGLRIDHALGLKRQFWVPDGADASAGAYVRFPFEALLSELAQASNEARCLVIGEDLGTVPAGFREALDGAGALSYRVVPFERDDERFRSPSTYPRLALACVSTHDLPPLAGWWDGIDIEEQALLGILNEDGAVAARSDRVRAKSALLAAISESGCSALNLSSDQAFTPELAGAIHAFMASTPCALAMIQVEDLAGERSPVNLPGTDMERPNWRRRIGVAVEALTDGQIARAIIDAARTMRPA